MKRGSTPLFCLNTFLMIKQSTIQQLVEEKIEGTDVFIIDITVSSSNQIKVILDADSGLSIDKCVEISRYIERNFDRDEEDFTLSVSSAGVDEGLKLPRQYKKNIGRELRVQLKGDHKKIQGVLSDVGNSGILLERKEKKRVEGRKKKEWVTTKIEPEFNDIEEAKVIVSFK